MSSPSEIRYDNCQSYPKTEISSCLNVSIDHQKGFSFSSSPSEDEFFGGLRKVINTINNHRDSWPFRESVDEKIAPLYYQIVRNPIDLSIITRKITDAIYDNLQEIEDDFKLLVNNCEKYNGPGNTYTLLSYVVWKQFRRLMKRFLNYEVMQEELFFLYAPQAKNRPKKSRHRKRKKGKTQALDFLAQAAEEAIRKTFCRSSSRISSSQSSPTKELSKQTGKLELNPPSPSTDTLTLNLNLGIPEENLSFKSLSEWSEDIKKSGLKIVLPEDSIIYEEESEEGTSDWSDSSDSSSSSGSDSSDDEQSINDTPDEKPRLVIKLSRCNSNSGELWKPLQAISGGESSSGESQEYTDTDSILSPHIPHKRRAYTFDMSDYEDS